MLSSLNFSVKFHMAIPISTTTRNVILYINFCACFRHINFQKMNENLPIRVLNIQVNFSKVKKCSDINKTRSDTKSDKNQY